jgi:formylglycine-generating enzyme required for sulfatase activity
MKQTGRVILFAILIVSVVGPAWADGPATRPRTQTIKIPTKRDVKNVSIDLVQLPGGLITLKDEQGRDIEHEVKPIWMAKFETRWDEYNIFWMGLDLAQEERYVNSPEEWRRTRTEPPYLNPTGATPEVTVNGAGYPADCITLSAAKKYCAWLSRVTEKKFRLPTEAEWEYACRAGGPPLKPDAKALDAVAWFKGNAADLPYGARPGTRFDDDYGRIHPVGQKQANAWGLYDMLGNVGEYVVRDPKNEKGLLAGGSFQSEAKDVHSGAREPYSKDWRRNEPQEPFSPDWLTWSMHRAGFRVVMEE